MSSTSDSSDGAQQHRQLDTLAELLRSVWQEGRVWGESPVIDEASDAACRSTTEAASQIERKPSSASEPATVAATSTAESEEARVSKASEAQGGSGWAGDIDMSTEVGAGVQSSGWGGFGDEGPEVDELEAMLQAHEQQDQPQQQQHKHFPSSPSHPQAACSDAGVDYFEGLDSSHPPAAPCPPAPSPPLPVLLLPPSQSVSPLHTCWFQLGQAALNLHHPALLLSLFDTSATAWLLQQQQQQEQQQQPALVPLLWLEQQQLLQACSLDTSTEAQGESFN